MESQNSLPWIELDCIHLPSRGVPYPPDSKVKYRTYSHGEIRQFATTQPSMQNSLQMALNGIETLLFDKNQLTLIDVIYIGLMMRVGSVGDDKFELPFQCEKCESIQKRIFKGSELEFDNLNEKVKRLPIEADITNRVFNFSPITVKSFIEMEQGRYNKITAKGKPDATLLEALMVTNIETEEAYKILYNLSDKEDIQTLEAVDSYLMHDIKPLKAVCENLINETCCQHVNYVQLEGREAIIRPFRDGERSIGHRIRLGD